MSTLLSLTAALALLAAPATDDLPTLVEQVRTERDQVEPDVLLSIGDVKTREAAEALIELYDLFQTAYMRRHALRALAKFDGVDDAEQLALQKLLDEAVGSRTAALREAAVDSMAQCRNLGKAFLAMVVESAAEDDIRVRAMRYHTSDSRREDAGWYRMLWEQPMPGEMEVRAARERLEAGDVDYEPEPWPLVDVRWLAFEVLATELSEQDVLVANADRDVRVRTRALLELEQRGYEEFERLAEFAFKSSGPPEWTEYRIAGAEILLRLHGAKAADDLIKLVTRVDAPVGLRDRVADLLAELGDEKLSADLAKLVGRGKPYAKLFALRAARDLPDEKGRLEKAIRKGLKEKDIALRLATLETISHRGDQEAIEDVQKLFDKTKDEEERAACLDTLVVLRKNDAEFVAELVRDTHAEERELRNAAIRSLGLMKDPAYTEAFLDALQNPDWDTRLQALRALEALRTKSAVGAIIERMAEEIGRLELECGEALFRLTGQLFGTNQPAWAAWWEESAESFEFPSKLDMKRAGRERENLDLKEVSRTEFFGIEVRSHRVIFIIDVSGSMEERSRGRYVGEEGDTRLEIAKRELVKALESLDKRSLFNLVTFNDRAGRWSESIQEVNEESLTSAREYVLDQRAGGSTNLFAALGLAFEDPDVDTVFVLSDGEPTVEPTDPDRIVREVEFWNKNRGVTVHAVAVGARLQILRRLAEGTGGRYVEYP